MVWARCLPYDVLAESLMTKAFLPTSSTATVWAPALSQRPPAPSSPLLHAPLAQVPCRTLCLPLTDGLICSSRTCLTWKMWTQASLWKARMMRSSAPRPHHQPSVIVPLVLLESTAPCTSGAPTPLHPRTCLCQAGAELPAPK